MMYADGTGGPKDDVAARSLFEKAAAQGHAEAMVWSGAFVQLGRGGPEDASAAKAYFQKARRSVMKKPRRVSSAWNAHAC